MTQRRLLSPRHEHGHTSRSGHQVTQQFQPLCRHLDVEKLDSCQVAVRRCKAGNKSEPDRSSATANKMDIAVVAALAANADAKFPPAITATC
jgi:hypothetical protein